MKFSLFLRKDLPAFRFTEFISIIINLNFAIIHFMQSKTEKTGFQSKDLANLPDFHMIRFVITMKSNPIFERNI